MSEARFGRGGVIGKFYPPHRGHRHLIETALRDVDELSIIICGRPDEHPEPDLRASWLEEMFPEARIKLIDDRYDPTDSALWAQLTVEWLGFKPDVAFTSESYGPRWASLMGCVHVAVDPERTQFPVSGLSVRSNPMANWRFLDPPVRGYYARRVVIVGAESSGTTTMARALAEHYGTVWVEEYGRRYSEEMFRRLGRYDWRSADFVHIATEQARLEDAAAREANRILFCDTDAFATSIWHERYLGTRSSDVDAIAAKRRPDLYLLTDVDIPFVQDGYRDGEAIRTWMHGRFVAELQRSGRPYVVLSGPHAHRLRIAVEAVDPLLN
jgi:HTH-type transcriptional regulator, transcriptional repressor of NAD biosynthesis genes